MTVKKRISRIVGLTAEIVKTAEAASNEPNLLLASLQTKSSAYGARTTATLSATI